MRNSERTLPQVLDARCHSPSPSAVRRYARRWSSGVLGRAYGCEIDRGCYLASASFRRLPLRNHLGAWRVLCLARSFVHTHPLPGQLTGASAGALHWIVEANRVTHQGCTEEGNCTTANPSHHVPHLVSSRPLVITLPNILEYALFTSPSPSRSIVVSAITTFQRA